MRAEDKRDQIFGSIARYSAEAMQRPSSSLHPPTPSHLDGDSGCRDGHAPFDQTPLRSPRGVGRHSTASMSALNGCKGRGGREGVGGGMVVFRVMFRARFIGEINHQTI